MEFSTYLNFNGNCEEAMNFYKDALGAEMKGMNRFGDMPPMPGMEVSEEDKNKVLHCSIEKDGYIIMASDCPPHISVTFGNNANISMNFSSREDTEQIFNALAAGGQVTMPLQDTFWGAYFGMCTDKFGTCWMFNYDQPKA